MNPEPIDRDLLDVLGLADAYASNPGKAWDYARRQTWATPAAFVRGLEMIAGARVELDLCAEESTAKARVWYGPRSPHGVTDTLRGDWSTDARLAWCNPDFARKAQWVDLILRKGVPVWLLVPPTTDQAWFSDLVRHPRAHWHALGGRLKFEPPPGVPATSPNGPVVLWSVNFDRPLLPSCLLVRDVLKAGGCELD